MKIYVTNNNSTTKVLDTTSGNEAISVMRSIVRLATTMPKLKEIRCVFDSEDHVPDIFDDSVCCNGIAHGHVAPEGAAVGYPSEETVAALKKQEAGLRKHRELVQKFCNNKVGSKNNKGYYSPELDNCCERDFEL